MRPGTGEGPAGPGPWAAIRALPPRHRVTVYLADIEGYRYGEISALTGIPVGSVKSCLHRGRGQLRARPRPRAGAAAATGRRR